MKEATYDPAKYINQYYILPEGHSEEGLADHFYLWQHEAFEIIPECDTGLEIGCGPVLNLSAFASRKVKNIILTQFNTDCFQFIQRWMVQHPDAPNWTQHFKWIQKMEKTDISIQERVRNALNLCLKIDLTTPHIFEHPFFKKVDVIASSLCIQAVAQSHENYKEIIGNLKKYLKPNGYIFLIGVLDETFYMVEEQRLPCFKVNEKLLEETMNEHGFEIIKLNSIRLENPPTDTSDFKGLFSVLAKLNGESTS